MVHRNRKQGRPVALGYIRMSTARQDLSPHAQAAAIDAWAAREGVDLVACYYDLGVSGSKDTPDRPGIAAALDELRAYRATYLVAAKADRFARDPDVAGYIATMARRAGAILATADDGHKQPIIMRSVTSAMDATELQKIRDRTTAALAVKRARGERLGGRVPYGSRTRPDGCHVVRDGMRRCAPECTGCLSLEADPGEQRTISRALDLSRQGLGVRAIAATLASEGVRNRAGKALAFQAVHTLLRLALSE